MTPISNLNRICTNFVTLPVRRYGISDLFTVAYLFTVTVIPTAHHSMTPLK